MANYIIVGKNPVKLGSLGVMKKREFELTTAQEGEAKIKRQIEAGLIKKVSVVKAPVTRPLLTGELVATLTAKELEVYTVPELKAYAKDVLEGSDSMTKPLLIAALKEEED